MNINNKELLNKIEKAILSKYKSIRNYFNEIKMDPTIFYQIN